MSMMVSFVLSFVPRDVLDEILNLIESVSEDFPSYSFKKIEKHIVQILHRGSVNSGHWFTVSTLNGEDGCINVFDSAFND